MSDGFISDEVDGITRHIFLHSGDDAIDAWVSTFHEFMNTADQPFFYLFDISGQDVYFTPYARKTAKDLFSDYRNHKGYMAFIMVWVTGPHIAKLFFASLGKLAYDVQFFNTPEEGLAWLREMKGLD